MVLKVGKFSFFLEYYKKKNLITCDIKIMTSDIYSHRENLQLILNFKIVIKNWKLITYFVSNVDLNKLHIIHL